MGKKEVKEVEEVDRIVRLVATEFNCFGGGGEDDNARFPNPLARAMAKRPPSFALGVDVAEVVAYVLREAGKS